MQFISNAAHERERERERERMGVACLPHSIHGGEGTICSSSSSSLLCYVLQKWVGRRRRKERRKRRGSRGRKGGKEGHARLAALR